jgi:hypothetical protein
MERYITYNDVACAGDLDRALSAVRKGIKVDAQPVRCERAHTACLLYSQTNSLCAPLHCSAATSKRHHEHLTCAGPVVAVAFMPWRQSYQQACRAGKGKQRQGGLRARRQACCPNPSTAQPQHSCQLRHPEWTGAFAMSPRQTPSKWSSVSQQAACRCDNACCSTQGSGLLPTRSIATKLSNS